MQKKKFKNKKYILIVLNKNPVTDAQIRDAEYYRLKNSEAGDSHNNNNNDNDYV